jgi:hypothetical protein
VPSHLLSFQDGRLSHSRCTADEILNHHQEKRKKWEEPAGVAHTQTHVTRTSSSLVTSSSSISLSFFFFFLKQ